jgi:hypothetical protein
MLKPKGISCYYMLLELFHYLLPYNLSFFGVKYYYLDRGCLLYSLKEVFYYYSDVWYIYYKVGFYFSSSLIVFS